VVVILSAAESPHSAQRNVIPGCLQDVRHPSTKVAAWALYSRRCVWQ